MITLTSIARSTLVDSKMGPIKQCNQLLVVRGAIIAAFLVICGQVQSEINTKGPPPRPWEQRYHALSMPKPEYPYEARRQRISGNGIVAVEVDYETGLVKTATMKKSTGSELLDDATLRAARRWRFQPAAVKRLEIPVSFAITGVTLG